MSIGRIYIRTKYVECPSIDNELNVKSSQLKTMCVGVANLTHVYPYIIDLIVPWVHSNALRSLSMCLCVCVCVCRLV